MRISAFQPGVVELRMPTRINKDVTTGSWKTRPKDRISVMISPRYSETFGRSWIET